MGSDLKVQNIALPSPVVGACPTKVYVNVINEGTDPAPFPVRMKVCLDIKTSLDGLPTAHYEVLTPVELPPLQPAQPGQAPPVLRFVFDNVIFPCASSGFVIATADCDLSVPNNDRTAPQRVEPVPKIDAVPWLWTDLRVGLKDSTGFVTWSPPEVCAGSACVAEVSLRNAGCGAAPASVTTLDLLDGAGQSITALTYNTPAIAAGATIVIPFATTLPAAVAGQQLTVRACADSTGVVTGQCDLTHACAEETFKIATARPPGLTFAAPGSIFPGDPIPVIWRMENTCADLGKVTARVSYRGTGLYTSTPINIGLQEGPKGGDPVIDPTVVPASFYKIGTSTLTLEAVGTGSDPGPYTATTTVRVLAEPASGRWAFTAPMPGIPGSSLWKRAYDVGGRLTNPAHASMSPSSVVLNETSTVQAPATLLATPTLTMIVPGAFGTAVWSRTQTWSWLVPGIWVPKGPFSGTFTYSVTFAMQDAYGNAYPAVTSPGTTVLVSVSTLKTVLAGFAFAFAIIGFGLFAAGLIAIAAGITAGYGAVLEAAAGVAFGIAAGFGAGALDPPVPDFDYRRIEPVALPQFPQAVTESAALAPLLPVFALLARMFTIVAAMSATEARLIAARIDRDRAAIDLQSAEYRQSLDSLLAATDQVPAAVMAALEGIGTEPVLGPALDDQGLQQTVAGWARDGVSAKERRAWRASGLAREHLRVIDLALTTEGFTPRPLDAVLADLPQLAARFASAMIEEAETVLHPLSDGVGRAG